MTQDRERFWTAVDDALDARRDPREEALVREWIADHPDDRDAISRLMRRLDVVAHARRTLLPRTTPPRIALPMLAAAAVVVLGVHLWTPAGAKDAPLHRVPSRVVSFSVEVTREGDGRSTTIVSQPDHFERTEVTRLGATNIVSSLESRQP